MRTSPIEHWNWAIRDASCPPTISGENLGLNLMPKAEASITDRGVFHNGLLYACKAAKQKQQFTRAELGKSNKVKITYNLQKVDRICLRLDDEEYAEKRHLAPQLDATRRT